MTAYMISFPSDAMQVPEEDLPAVGEAARAVVREARAAGILLFTGGIDQGAPPVTVAGDGAVTEGTYPHTGDMAGGFCLLELATREEALGWAAKLAAACRCPQEVRQFWYDPDSYPESYAARA